MSADIADAAAQHVIERRGGGLYVVRVLLDPTSRYLVKYLALGVGISVRRINPLRHLLGCLRLTSPYGIGHVLKAGGNLARPHAIGLTKQFVVRCQNEGVKLAFEDLVAVAPQLD